MVTVFLTMIMHRARCLMMCVIISVKELERACILQIQKVAGKILTNGSKTVFGWVFFLDTEVHVYVCITNASG